MVIPVEIERAARIELSSPASRAVVSPMRGALCLAWSVGGRELLYLDEATLSDPTRNVRGGVPVLFPSPGKLAGGHFEFGGRGGSMGQHGFARGLPFRVVGSGTDEVTLLLSTTEETLAQFPFPFTLQLRVRVEGASLHLDQRVDNRGDAPLPVALGFHPYFLVAAADKASTRIETAATRAFDNTGGQLVSLDGPIALAAGEVDLHLLDHGRSDAAIVLADGARIELHGSPEYRRWVVWTLPGRDFVCLEPWTAPADALNTGEDLIVLPPGQGRDLAMELRFVGG